MSHQSFALCILLFVSSMLCAGCGGCGEEAPGGAEGPRTPTSTSKETVALLEQALKDDLAWDKRLRGQSDRQLFGSRSARTLYARYRVVYAKEQLIARGSVGVPALLEITHDPRRADIRCAAFEVLGELDPSLCLREVYNAAKRGGSRLRKCLRMSSSCCRFAYRRVI